MKKKTNVFEEIGKLFSEVTNDLLAIFDKKREHSAAPKEHSDKSWKKFYKYGDWTRYLFKEIIENVVIILVLLIVIREAVGEFRFIPSESMVPSLEIGDKLFVEKFSKRFRKQFQRGDIVIFYPTAKANDGKEVIKNDPFSVFARLTGLPFLPQPEAYIKRVIGLPGETIEIKANQGVFINGEFLEEPYLEASPYFLPDYNMRPKKIPKGKYIVLGDNRNYSSDSHVWGFLPKNRIIGRAAFLIYRPLNEKPEF